MTPSKLEFIGGTAEISSNDELTIRVDLSTPQALSTSGSSAVIASTKGQRNIEGITISVHIHCPKSRFSSRELENLEPISDIVWNLSRE